MTRGQIQNTEKNRKEKNGGKRLKVYTRKWQRDRETERRREGETERQKDRETEKQRDRETEKQICKETERHRG